MASAEVNAALPMQPEEMNGEQLRTEAATNLHALASIDAMRMRIIAKQERIEARLLSDQSVRLKPGEGIDTGNGILRVHEETVGKAYVVKDEVDKRGGELPEDLQPIKDQRVVIESFHALKEAKPGVAAELMGLMASPLDEGADDALVKATDKTKYPTVAKLRKAFGDDTALVGKPAKTRAVVLERPGIGDEPLLIGTRGMLGVGK